MSKRSVIIGFCLTVYDYPFFKYDKEIEPVSYIRDWQESIKKNGLDCVLIIDKESKELQQAYPHIQFHVIKKKPDLLNQMDARWVYLYEYLVSHPEIEKFFIIDTGDSTVLKNPFDFIEKHKIYVGDETAIVGIEWMNYRVGLINNQRCTNYFQKIKDKQLLNCGIFGGYTQNLLPVIQDIAEILKLYNCKSDTVDMIVFNQVLYSLYEDKIVHGKPLNTEFWKWDYANQECFFQHK